MTTDISIITPTYCEKENLSRLINEINALRPAFDNLELIIVDDNSPDGTSQYLQTCMLQHPWVKLITREHERDLSTAVIAGFNQAHYPILLCLDADLSHPTEVIPKMVLALSQPNVDFVIGSRFIDKGSTAANWSWRRRLNAFIAKMPARLFTSVKDPLSGFFCLRKKTFEHADPLNPIGYKIGLELIVKCNCKQIVEIPIHFKDRTKGNSKLNMKEIVNYLRHLYRLWKTL